MSLEIGIGMSLGSSVSIVVSPYRLGPELIINGGFDSDANWLKGTGWTIAGGVAVGAPGVQSSIDQNIAGFIQNDLYLTVYTIVTLAAGGITLNMAGKGGVTRTTAGVFTEVLEAGPVSSVLINKDAAGDCSIDNVSVRKIL